MEGKPKHDALNVDINPMVKKKRELLEHYAWKYPKRFYQFDFSTNIPPLEIDEALDDDGDHLCWQETMELMTGVDVRVLIRPGTTRQEAIRGLEKINPLKIKNKF